MERTSVKRGNDRKRKHVFCEKESPFPVPISTITGLHTHSDKWCYYTGYLQENFVSVHHSGDMDLLYKMGYFGKGNLSRHQPTYAQGGTHIHNRKKKKDEQMLKITSRRKYLRHVAWSTGKSVDIVPLRFDSATDQERLQDLKDDENRQIVKQMRELEETELPPTEKKSKSVSDLKEDDSYSWEDPEESSNRSTKEVELDPWTTTTSEESSAFWDMPSSPPKNKLCVSKINDEEIDSASVNYKAAKTEDKAKECVLNNDTPIPKPTKSLADVSVSDKQFSENVTATGNSTSKNFQSFLVNVNECNENKDLASSTKYCDNKSSRLNINDPQTELEHGRVKSDISSCTIDQEPSCSKSVIQKNEKDNSGDLLKVSVKTDPLCLSDHEDGDLFVVNDTDESDSETLSSKLKISESEAGLVNGRLKWEPAVKRDPAKQKEMLYLSFEEAFFLSYGLGCLVVMGKDEKPLNLTEMWREFSKRQKTFIPHYIAYHSFRSKGWVPKTGLKFGGDFMLYKDGPPFYHASYVVMVRTVDEKTLRDSSKYQNEKLSWRLLSGQNRVTEQAAKELMLCHVIKPAISDLEMQSPKCIPKFKVQEVVMKRWLTKHERENLQYIEIP